MVEDTKGVGKTINGLGRGNTSGRMETCSSGSGNRTKDMATGNIYGRREEKSTKGGGLRTEEMAGVYTRMMQVVNMMGIDATTKCMEMGGTLGVMALCIMEGGFMAFNAALVNFGN